jgi:hypothetical protein
MHMFLAMENHVPRITFIEYCCGNDFGCIHSAAATKSNDDIALFLTGDSSTASDRGDSRIGLYSGTLDNGHTGLLKRGNGPIESAVALDAASAGYQ